MASVDRTVTENALGAATARLKRAGVPGPRAEAELLLAWVLAIDRGRLAARSGEPIPEDAARRFDEAIARRAAREPFQHITGRQEFRGLELEVGPEVLIPRPETEGVVEAVLALGLPEAGRVADLGTGSGCIAIALAIARPDLTLLALDASSAALAIAERNARRNGVASRITFVRGTIASPPREWTGMLDAVVCNPPYVSEADWAALEPEVRDHEPKEALVPGPTGLEAYRELAPAAWLLLRPEGHLVLELGYDSEAGARRQVRAAGFEILETVPDFQQIPRVLIARRPDGRERHET